MRLSRAKWNESKSRMTLLTREEEAWQLIERYLQDNINSIRYRFFIRESRHRDHVANKEDRFWKKIHRRHLRMLNISEKQYKKALKVIAKHNLIRISPIIVAKVTIILNLETEHRGALVQSEHLSFQIIYEEHLFVLGITWKLLKKARDLCAVRYPHLKPIQLIFIHNTCKDEDQQRRRIIYDEEHNQTAIYELEKRYNHFVFFNRESQPFPERVVTWHNSKKLNYDVIVHILEYITDDIDSIITILRDMFNMGVPVVLSQIFGFEKEITFAILSKYNSITSTSYISKTQIKNAYHLPPCIVITSSKVEAKKKDRIVKYKQQDVFVQLINIYNSTTNEKLKIRLQKYHDVIRYY